jgi:hypothetical protein
MNEARRRGEREDRPRGTSTTCADGFHRRHNKGRPGSTPYAQGARRRPATTPGADARALRHLFGAEAAGSTPSLSARCHNHNVRPISQLILVPDRCGRCISIRIRRPSGEGGTGVACRPAHDDAVRPCPGGLGPERHLYHCRVRGRGGPIPLSAAPTRASPSIYLVALTGTRLRIHR